MSIKKDLQLFAKDLTLLIAEDQVQINDVLKDLLSKFFKKVDCVYDGKEALEKYQKNSYDIVLSDILMPHINGVVLSREIRNLNREQAIIILSGSNELEYLVELIDIKVNQFVAKPFNTSELVYRVLKVCENIIYKKHFVKNLNNKTPSSKNLKYEEKKLLDMSNIKMSTYIEHKQVDSKSFIAELKDDKLLWDTMNSHIDELIMINDEFGELIGILNLGKYEEETIKNIAYLLNKIHNIFTFIESLDNLGEIIKSLATFLDSLEINSLDIEQKNKLKILEFIYDDISRFIQTVFIYQDSLDVYYLEDSLKSSIEQLTNNVLNKTIEEEELEFF